MDKKTIIMQEIEEELKKRGIDISAIDDEAIEAYIQRRVTSLERQIDKEEANIARVVDTKLKDKKKKKQQSRIVDMLLSGMSAEEISKQVGYPLEEVEKLEKDNKARILAIQLISKRDVSNQLGIRIQTLNSNLRRGTYKGKSIGEVIRQKEKVVIQRLEQGQSAEEIAADKELNVDETAVKEIEVRHGRRKEIEIGKRLNEGESAEEIVADEDLNVSKREVLNVEDELKEDKTAQINKDDRQKIVEQLILGKTPEEIHSSEEFEEYSLDEIEKLKQQNMAKILAMQLVPIREISEKIGLPTRKISDTLRNFRIGGRTISSLRVEKFKQLRKRIAQGETEEELLEDKDLDVSKEVLESEIKAMEAKKMEEEREEQPEDPEEAYKKVERMRERYKEQVEANEPNYLAQPKEASSMLVRQITDGIAKGTLNVKKAQQLLNEEANKKARNGKTNQFALTAKENKAVLVEQIKKALVEQGSENSLEDPEKSIRLLQAVTGESEVTGLEVVVRSQIASKQFDEAQSLCEEYGEKRRNGLDTARIQALKKEVRNAQIGDLVSKAMTSDMQKEEEQSFWELLKSGIKKGNVKKGDVILGKAKGSSKNVTLQDVWPEEEKGKEK